MRRLPPPSELGAVTAWAVAAARWITTSASVPSASVRTRLFRKYVALFVTIVCAALLANGLLDIWFSYQDHKNSLIRIQHEQAEAAAGKIGQFVKEVEAQLGWTVQLPWSASTIEQRRVDALRPLPLVPAVPQFAPIHPPAPAPNPAPHPPGPPLGPP